jgi:hypothetical protein
VIPGADLRECRLVQGFLRPGDVVLGAPGRLPENEEGLSFLRAAECLYDLLNESPAWHLGPAEQIVHSRRTDIAAPGSNRDLPHRGSARF